jgi:hypothetical protein
MAEASPGSAPISGCIGSRVPSYGPEFVNRPVRAPESDTSVNRSLPRERTGENPGQERVQSAGLVRATRRLCRWSESAPARAASAILRTCWGYGTAPTDLSARASVNPTDRDHARSIFSAPRTGQSSNHSLPRNRFPGRRPQMRSPAQSAPVLRGRSMGSRIRIRNSGGQGPNAESLSPCPSLAAYSTITVSWPESTLVGDPDASPAPAALCSEDPSTHLTPVGRALECPSA